MGIRGQYKNKRDENEPDIVAEFLAHGFSVERLDKPLDLLLGYHGVTLLVEVKNGPKAPLTKPQERFFENWRGQSAIICSVEEARQFAREIRWEHSQAIPMEGFIE